MTHLSDHLKQRRMEKGLTVRQVAKMVGYTNLSKGVRRIDTFERDWSCQSRPVGEAGESLGR